MNSDWINDKIESKVLNSNSIDDSQCAHISNCMEPTTTTFSIIKPSTKGWRWYCLQSIRVPINFSHKFMSYGYIMFIFFRSVGYEKLVKLVLVLKLMNQLRLKGTQYIHISNSKTNKGMSGPTYIPLFTLYTRKIMMSHEVICKKRNVTYTF